jgi:hypothetical protein
LFGIVFRQKSDTLNLLKDNLKNIAAQSDAEAFTFENGWIAVFAPLNLI